MTDKRKSKKTTKAAAIETEKAGSKKAKGKKSKVTVKDNGDELESDLLVNSEGVVTVKIIWTENLTWSLITAITDDDVVQQGLFPECGANASTSKSGGKKKIEHQLELAKMLFADHDLYGEVFKLAVTAEQKQWWATKIKNCLSSLVKATRKHLLAMGETGAGITSEEQINMSVDNKFMNKWAMIKDQFPWLWVMKGLIDEQPNFIPPETGNNQLVVDMSEYTPSTGFESTGDDWSSWGGVNEHDLEREIEEEASPDPKETSPDPVPSIPVKRKVEPDEPEKKT